MREFRRRFTQVDRMLIVWAISVTLLLAVVSRIHDPEPALPACNATSVHERCHH